MSGAVFTGLASAALVAALLIGAAAFSWVERRLLGFVQERRGPNRAGPLGALQWAADAVKMLTKADVAPPGGDRVVFRIAPVAAAAPVLAAFGLVAFGEGLILAPHPVGLLLILGLAALPVYGLVLGAWASNSKYARLGGMRTAAQLLAYEAFFGLTLAAPVLLASEFSIAGIVAAQADLWFAVEQPVAFALFLVAGVAAAHRLPFDLPEAENDLVAGYATEYAGLSFGLFFLGEYLSVMLVSALAATLFLGGWLGPWLPGPVWFALKAGAVALFLVLLRAALPRPRYDQLVNFAWRRALPLALLNLLATGAVVVLGRAP